MRPRKPLGRYDLTGARDLGQRVTPASAQVSIALVAVDDPAPDPARPGHQRVVASANRRVDILEWERAHGRISEAAYRVGRLAQALFERASRLGAASTWRQGSRVDATLAQELAVIGRIEDARRIAGYVSRMTRMLGATDAAIVRQVLGDNRSYRDVVLPPLRRRPSPRDTAYVARRFRDALELLADRSAARGAAAKTILTTRRA